MATKPTGERQIAVEIAARFAETAEKLPPVLAYVFTRSGALLAQAQLDEGGRANLAITAGQEPLALRVVLGPEIAKDQLDIGELLRRGGIEQHLAIRPNLERLPPLEFAIGPELTKFWLAAPCLVRGTLLKQVVSGGVTLRLPVCHATIDIYEVDPWPWIIIRLPEIDLDRLRDIVDGPWPPIDLPIPPRPWDDVLATPFTAISARRSFDPQPDPPSVRSAALPADLAIAARAPPGRSSSAR